MQSAFGEHPTITKFEVFIHLRWLIQCPVPRLFERGNPTVLNSTSTFCRGGRFGQPTNTLVHL
jgi:hypothetical protein